MNINNIISSIDNFLYKVHYKLGLKSAFYSREQLLLRYVSRDAKHLHPEDYKYAEHPEQSKIAWVFWAQGEEKLLPILKQCYESIKRNCGEYQITFVTMENVDSYVDIPKYIMEKVEKGQISLTHFSDFLRVSLLNKWGGYWVDVTLFLSKPLLNRSSLFTIRQPYDERHVSKCMWTGYLWYMPKGHPLAYFLSDYLTQYWKTHDKVVDYLLIDYAIRVFYLKNKTFASEIDGLPLSNPDLYFFQSPKCEDPFDIEKWCQICENTSFFKTTWKCHYKEISGCDFTFYGKLINSFVDLL